MVEFVVCDDEKLMVSRIKDVIKNTIKDCEYSVVTFDDYNGSFKKYVADNRNSVIYILDIEMPSESGISMAKYIRNIDKKSIIIIVTSHHESADEIYKSRLNILTFVSKYDRCLVNLALAVEDSMTYLYEESDVIRFNDLSNSYSINANDILYINKDCRKTIIKTINREYDVYLSLNTLFGLLPSYFKQSHRSCIINMNRVAKINFTKKVISFDNGLTIDYIGDKYKKELLGCKKY
jgi:DNA-binding LytR/AlgR family response regulator